MADGILNPIEQLEAEIDFDVYTKQEVDALLDEKADKSDTYTKTETDALLDDKADADSVYTKTEIDTKIPNTVGSATKPTYVNGGVITECTYELNKTVPANAVFTDTTYTAGNGLNLIGTSFSAKAGANVSVDSGGINVNGNGVVASADSGLVSGGTAYTELRPTLDGTWVKNAQTTAINLQKLEGGIEYLYGLLSHQYDQLKKYINGNYYDYDTDTDSKYTKTVPQGAMPYASLDSIGGKTLVWNQIFPSLNATNLTVNSTAGTLTDNGDGTVTYTLTTASSYAYIKTNIAGIPLMISGHTYYCRIDIKTPGTSVSMRTNNSNNAFKTWSGLTADTRTVLETIGPITTGETNPAKYIYPTWTTGATGECVLYGVMLVDLTLMFGSGNEPSTVAEFQQMFPAQYYPYNAGTLLSAGVTEVVSNGKNLLPNTLPSNTINATIASGGAINSATNARVFAIPCEPNTDYMLSQKVTPSAWGRVGFANVLPAIGNTIDDKGSMANRLAFSINSGNNHYMIMQFSSEADFISNVNSNEPMIEVGTAKTNYAPYKAPIQYPISAEIQALEGYGWSAGSVYNYIDYERKVFVQNVGAVDLGTMTWIYITGASAFSSNTIPNLYERQRDTDNNAICEKYVPQQDGWLAVNLNNMSFFIRGDNTTIYIKDTNYTDATAFTSAMSGVMLYYQLATPIETDISQYLTDDNLISVESGGTLTFPNSNGDDYRIDVPSSETFMVDLQEAI